MIYYKQDIDSLTEEAVQSENIYWDTEKYTYEKFEAIIKKAIKSVVKFYKGNIDDWDLFEYEVVCKANEMLGNNEDD